MRTNDVIFVLGRIKEALKNDENSWNDADDQAREIFTEAIDEAIRKMTLTDRTMNEINEAFRGFHDDMKNILIDAESVDFSLCFRLGCLEGGLVTRITRALEEVKK